MKGTMNAHAVTQAPQLVLPGMPESTVSPEDLGDTWATPPWLVRGLEDLTGRLVGVDVCAEAWSRKGPMWWGPGSPYAEDGLRVDWREVEGWVRWCNPPYANIDPWVERALALGGARAPTWLLVPARTDRPWWHALDEAAEQRRAWVTWLEGRVQFAPPPGVVVKNNKAPGGVVLWQVGGGARLLDRRIHVDRVKEAGGRR